MLNIDVDVIELESRRMGTIGWREEEAKGEGRWTDTDGVWKLSPQRS
jgi:hypothetical protein